MNFVLDANILLSLMKLDSVASYLLFSLRAKFFAPVYILEELKEHESEFLLKSGLSEHEFKMRLSEIKEFVRFCEESEYTIFLKKAKDSLFDPEDTAYVALALSINAAIWSNDPHLRQQSLVKVYTTRELVDGLLRSEL